MRKLDGIIKAELVLLWGQIKSYKFNFILYSLDTYLLFMGIFIGVGIRLFSDRGTIFMLIGMVFWLYAVMSIRTISGIIQSELRRGTFEQLLMTRTSLILLTSCKFIVKALYETLQIIAITFLLILTLGFSTVFDRVVNIPFFIAILIITTIGLYGLGYSIAGLSIIFKRVGAVAGAASNFILFFSGLVIPLSLVPKELTYISYVFPFFWGMRVMESYTEYSSLLNMQYFSFLLLTSSIWFIIGVVVFKSCLRIAMSQGITSHY